MGGLKGVFFDLYGTLLVYGDMERAWNDWLFALHGRLSDAGLNLPKTRFSEACDGFFSREIAQSGNDGLTVYERRISRLCGELGAKLERGRLRSSADASLAAWQRYVQPDPAAIDVLHLLREEFTLALVTNFDHPPHLHRCLPQWGFAALFETIVISGEVGVRKPSPGIFEIALRRTGLKAEQVVYVGDSYKEDISGSLSAGIRPILIDRPDRIGSSDFAHKGEAAVASSLKAASRSDIAGTISRLDQLPNLLKEIGI